MLDFKMGFNTFLTQMYLLLVGFKTFYSDKSLKK